MKTEPFKLGTRNLAVGLILALAVLCLAGGPPTSDMDCPSLDGVATFCASSGAVDPGAGPVADLPVPAVTPIRSAPGGLVWSVPDPPWRSVQGGLQTSRAPPPFLA